MPYYAININPKSVSITLMNDEFMLFFKQGYLTFEEAQQALAKISKQEPKYTYHINKIECVLTSIGE